ncbi:hypothetical protein LCGC14_3103440, partial [marine sediment metagenome]
MPIPQGTETVASLAEKVKLRFPQFSKYDDLRVVQELISRSAKYQTSLSIEGLQQLASEAVRKREAAAGEAPGLLRSAYELGKGFIQFPFRAGANVAISIPETYRYGMAERRLKEAGLSPEALGKHRPMVAEETFDLSQLQAAKEAYERGEYSQMAARGVAAVTPFFGQMASGVGETTARHGRWAGIKQAAPIVATVGLARGIGGLRARGAQLRTAPRPAPAPRSVPRLAPAPGRRALPPVRGPEIGIERELPAGGVVRPVPPPTTQPGPDLVLGRQQPLTGDVGAPAPAPGLP